MTKQNNKSKTLSLNEYRWSYLPYGFWTEKDGSVVIFNRRYEPIWRKRSERIGNEEWESIDNSQGKVWIRYANEIHFYYDGDVAKEKQLVERLIVLSARMNIPIPLLNKGVLAPPAQSD